MAGKRGGARPGAGRKPGKVSAAKRAIAEVAQEHAEAALKVLVDIAEDTSNPASARVSAANAILDRGYGKPVPIEQEQEDNSLTQALQELAQRGSPQPFGSRRGT